MNIHPLSPITKIVWFSWEIHRRNRSLSALLGAMLYEICSDKTGISRYLLCIRTTIRLLRNTTRDTAVFAQNPSVILSLIVAIYGRIFKRIVVIDAHNIGVDFEHPKKISRLIGQYFNHLVSRIASIVIVTNEELCSVIRRAGGRPFVLPDPLPELKPKIKKPLLGKTNVIVICTFSFDEPFQAIINAAGKLPYNTVVYFTGNVNKALLPDNLSDNIIFTGYLDEQEYIDYLNSSDIVIDLTTRNSCLVCGAYEAMALAKPLILSDTKALKEYFGEGATYTRNSPEAIADAIIKVSGNLEGAKELVLKRRAEIIRDFPEKIRNLKTILYKDYSTFIKVEGY